jgi:hypothetical protein
MYDPSALVKTKEELANRAKSWTALGALAMILPLFRFAFIHSVGEIWDVEYVGIIVFEAMGLMCFIIAHNKRKELGFIETVDKNWGQPGVSGIKQLDTDLDALRHWQSISANWDESRRQKYREEQVSKDFSAYKDGHDAMFKQIDGFRRTESFPLLYVIQSILHRGRDIGLLDLWLEERQAYYDIVTKKMYP